MNGEFAEADLDPPLIWTRIDYYPLTTNETANQVSYPPLLQGHHQGFFKAEEVFWALR